MNMNGFKYSRILRSSRAAGTALLLVVWQSGSALWGARQHSTAQAGSQSSRAAARLASVGSVTISPTSVTGGESAVGVVELDGVAPTGGLTLDLSSDRPTVIGTPGFVKIPAGASRAAFPITTAAGAGPETDHVEACVRGRHGVVGAITVMPKASRKSDG